MAGFVGMDVEAVRRLSQELHRAADQIQQIMNQLTSQLGSTDWKGPDADRFRNDWESQHRSALTNVINALQDASQHASRNADQQEQASQS